MRSPLATWLTACDKVLVTNVAGSVIHVGLSSWIIQDGNYGDFTVGQQAKFALEFGALDELRPATEGPLSAEHLGASRHRVRARVAYVAEGVWVIDAGAFMAFRERPHEGTQLGAFVEGDVYVGIDPFFYFERLYRIPAMPPLSYGWLIREIQLETTPWRDGRLPNGTRTRERDGTEVRRHLGIGPGTRLHWDLDGDRAVVSAKRSTLDEIHLLTRRRSRKRATAAQIRGGIVAGATRGRR